MRPDFTPRAALFDFDGVLGDTMRDNFLAWQKAMADFGVAIDADAYYEREGMKLVDLAKELYEAAKPEASVDPQEIVKLKEKYYLAGHSFSFYPGAVEFVNSLATRGIPIALVTAALKDRLARSVPVSFLDLFNAIMSGDTSGRGKPFPDPYLGAAKMLNIPIENCVVVENAPLGIRSAKSAGAYCVAISSTLGKDKLREADEIVTDIGALPTLDVFKFFLSKK